MAAIKEDTVDDKYCHKCIFSIRELYKSDFSAKIISARCEKEKLKWSLTT